MRSERGAAALWLTIRSGRERGSAVCVAGDEFVLGRDEDCDLVLADSRVSRRHAVLTRLPAGGFALRDLGSSNGTFVNGNRVDSAVLAGHEQIQVGDAVIASSREEPGRPGGATQLGAALTPSAVHRRVVQRSLRRVTVLASLAIVAAVGGGALFATGVLPPGGGERNAVQRTVEQVAPATVLVEVRRAGQRVGSGTGWVLDGAEGLVVTNAHVVNGGTSLVVGVDNDIRPTDIVGVAPCEDLAVLRVRDRSGLRSLPLGKQSSLRLGETVVAVGYPANASAEASLTSTTGVVSVVRTAYREAALDVPRYPNVVQTDAAINPGNSGGPLVDLEGRLVGVNSAGRTLSSDGRIIQGQNYAIGVDRVKEITSVLRTGRSIGWSGLGLGYPTRKDEALEKLPAGLLARDAVPGTGAAKAGLGSGGGVVVAVNGIPVDNSLASYCDAVAGVESGKVTTFSVLRPGAGKARDVRVTME
ncbi:MAG: trypsin-like peptidase domain-containing protein [Actinobacteria bacterium]|nr:trypsin-like peptidase domain-containing protein [Actinomycetota bacterium]